MHLKGQARALKAWARKHVSCLVRQRLNHHVLKLHVPGMALQADVARPRSRSVGWNRVARDKLTIQGHLDGCTGSFYLKSITLSRGFGSDARGWSQGVNGAGLMHPHCGGRAIDHL